MHTGWDRTLKPKTAPSQETTLKPALIDLPSLSLSLSQFLLFQSLFVQHPFQWKQGGDKAPKHCSVQHRYFTPCLLVIEVLIFSSIPIYRAAEECCTFYLTSSMAGIFFLKVNTKVTLFAFPITLGACHYYEHLQAIQQDGVVIQKKTHIKI